MLTDTELKSSCPGGAIFEIKSDFGLETQWVIFRSFSLQIFNETFSEIMWLLPINSKQVMLITFLSLSLFFFNQVSILIASVTALPRIRILSSPFRSV